MKFLLFLIFFANCLYAQDFVSLAKRTSSVYSTSADIDQSNPHEMTFETLLTNQKVFLSISATHLNSTFYTIVNSDQPSLVKKRNILPPEININDLKIFINGLDNPTSTCDGHDVSSSSDTSCTGKSCNLTQRVVSECNATDCWKTNPSSPRTFSEGLSEKFNLMNKVDISDCITDNIAGQKHTLKVQVTNSSPSVLNGGTITYSLVLQNDVANGVNLRRSK